MAGGGPDGSPPATPLRPADPAALYRALTRATQNGPYFALHLDSASPPGPRWRPVTVLYDPGAPSALAGLVAAVQARIGSEPRVAASLLFQGYAARLFSPALAAMADTRMVPDLPATGLYWRYIDGQPIGLWLPQPTGQQAERGIAPDATALVERAYRTVVTGHLVSLISALRQVVPISEGLLWGNAASALVGSARTLGTATAHRIAELLLGHEVLRDRGAWHTAQGQAPRSFRRRSCCLYYRVPGGGTCADCILGAHTGT